MKGIILDPDQLASDAASRGLSVTALARMAGISKNTVAKINRRTPIRPEVARRLDATLIGLPKLEFEHLREVPA